MMVILQKKFHRLLLVEDSLNMTLALFAFLC